LASNRVYNVLYENVAYCMVAFLVPLTTLVVFNVRLVVQLRRSRRLRRTLRPLQLAQTSCRDVQPRSRAGTRREGKANAGRVQELLTGRVHGLVGRVDILAVGVQGPPGGFIYSPGW